MIMYRNHKNKVLLAYERKDSGSPIIRTLKLVGNTRNWTIIEVLIISQKLQLIKRKSM